LPTWMVVEDEPDIYDVLLAMFEIWGIEGIAFVDGGEAVGWIEDVDKGNITSELPELAILDIRLPEVSGPEVGARLRTSERLGKIAIVMITAYRLSPEEEEQVKARAQADALMYKPLPAMPELRRVLDQIISKRKPPEASVPKDPQPVGPTNPPGPSAAPTTPPKPS
jgi:CheY-like chemotaxis protein